MAESNPTQVILTDDGLKIIKAQDTADEAVGNVNDINSDNKLTPSEKIKLKQEYDKDSKIYAIDVSQLQSTGLPTTELNSAMSNLTNFVTPLLKEMNITSSVDRNALNSVFTAFATADKNASQAFVNKVQQVADGAKKAGDDAKEAGEAAKQAADQAKADADTAQQTAQSSIDKINNINLKVSNADGTSSQVNINNDTILLDANKIIFNGKTSILDATIDTAKIANAAINTAQIADGAINNAKIANASIDDAKISNLNGNKIIAGSITAQQLNANDIIANVINGKTINGITINTPNLNMGDNGQITGTYSVNDNIGWFQPINGSGTLQISHGYIQSTANIFYYNKILNGIGGDKWGHWESSTQFVPAPDQAHPDISNIAESTLTPAFLKLDIFNADKSKVNSRAYIDGTGLYINDGNTQAISSMLSDYELLSSGMAYLNGGIQIKNGTTFTFGNLGMNGYHSIFMLDGRPLNFTDGLPSNNPVEIRAKTFTKASRLSIKHDIKPLSTAESSRLLNAIDIEKFRYTHDGATYKYQYGGVIDDVNSLGSKQYSMPPELLSEDGTGINLDSLTGILVKRVQDQDKTIAELSMRLTKLEMEK